MVNYYVDNCIKAWNLEDNTVGLGEGYFVTIFDTFDPKNMNPVEFMYHTIHGIFYSGFNLIYNKWLNRIDYEYNSDN